LQTVNKLGSDLSTGHELGQATKNCDLDHNAWVKILAHKKGILKKYNVTGNGQSKTHF